VQFKRGETFQVKGFRNKQIASKMLSIGIIPGSRLTIVRQVLGGRTLYLKVDGFPVALRRRELRAFVLDESRHS